MLSKKTKVHRAPVMINAKHLASDAAALNNAISQNYSGDASDNDTSIGPRYAVIMEVKNMQCFR